MLCTYGPNIALISFLFYGSDANQTYCNESCGFTLRSKPSTVLEGGVIGGSGAMDSPFLVSSDEHIRSAADLGEE